MLRWTGSLGELVWPVGAGPWVILAYRLLRPGRGHLFPNMFRTLEFVWGPALFASEVPASPESALGQRLWPVVMDGPRPLLDQCRSGRGGDSTHSFTTPLQWTRRRVGSTCAALCPGRRGSGADSEIGQHVPVGQSLNYRTADRT